MNTISREWCQRACLVVAIAVVMLVHGELQRISAQGPVAAYAFGEGTGTTTADASSNANTGTLGNGPTWTAGYFGRRY